MPVRVRTTLQVVVAFFLLCSTAKAWAQDPQYLRLFIDYPKPVMYVYDSNDQLLRIYPVALPRDRPPLPVQAWVRQVELGASWRPTGPTKVARAKKGIHLPDYVGPGDP